MSEFLEIIESQRGNFTYGCPKTEYWTFFLDLLSPPIASGPLLYVFSIQNFENLLQKMTFTYCYIGHICLTFQFASLQTSMIFECRRTVLWTLFLTLCVPLDWTSGMCILKFKILKICSKNDVHLLLHGSFLPHFPNSIVANFELQLHQQK